MIKMTMENELLPEMEDCSNCGHTVEHTPDHWELHWADWSKDWVFNLVTKSGYEAGFCDLPWSYDWNYAPTKADAIYQIRFGSESISLLPIHATQKNGIVKVIK